MPPSIDHEAGVQTKDTLFFQEHTLSGRLFLPISTNQNQKLPLIIYIHGGAFCVQTPFSPTYYGHLASLVKNGNVLVVVIPYRKAPEHPLPIAYDDACDAVKWVASHVNRDGPETWINQHADFEKMFLVGDSAGANITHNVGIRFGLDEGLLGVKIAGMVLVHPFFGKSDDQRSKLLEFLFPTLEGTSDPRINPVGAGVDLRKLGFLSKILVCVAGADQKYKDRGVSYYEAVKNSGWGGVVEIVETEGEDHGFHLFNPYCDRAKRLTEQIVSFINQQS
ncbi:hypothetical protein P3X46_018033 [Hevea brasiliensis]|uniref:Alpha/beta hydrolase fold-3 domain-containing protein n=1 Tax=Hevea brasiliensis TaxID=3981 RepID=A0ABQ9LPI9_HEVBR|nr:probable carboxylesterase 5 [Hevea brasiliensis]KAJ9169886.1 hypothetical protein P3X46_018033 [Hevea brasiliensis]